MALNNPIGSATAIAIADTSIVPATSGMTPNRGTAKSGVHSVPNRKSVIGTSRRNASVSADRTMMMPMVVPIDSRALPARHHSMSRSPRLIARVRAALRG
jgi:hypothetical protein